MKTCLCHPKRAFTLIELLVVVATISLLLSILLPTLGRAREQTKNVKCLSNLRSLAQGVNVYSADERDYLPGPLHPAIFKNQGIDALLTDPVRPLPLARALREQQRYLTFKIRRALSDSSGQKDSVRDMVATCPTMLRINPDSNFIEYYRRTQRYVYPTHYVINNYGNGLLDAGVAAGEGGGPVGNERSTRPRYYFGFSAWDGASAEVQALEKKYPPQPASAIRKPSEEWMIADAWWRPATNPRSEELQQEGSYQVNWTGGALPWFAPHFAKVARVDIDPARRSTSEQQARDLRLDGRTNTAFFDGHASPVFSKTLKWGNVRQLRGFPGTVNPARLRPDYNTPAGAMFWNGLTGWSDD